MAFELPPMRPFPACTLMLLLASGLALAEPPAESRWGLRWHAAPGCIQAEELTREVEARLGHPLFVSEPEFLVDGVLERRGTSDWVATLMILDARGTVLGRRELSTHGKPCSELGPRLSLVIALMIDPLASTHAPTVAAEASPPPPTPARLTTTAEAPPASPGALPTPSGRMGPGTGVTLAASGSLGLFYAPAGGIAVGFWVNPKQGLAWLLHLSLYPQVTFASSGELISATAVGAEVGACPASANMGRWFVSACGTTTFTYVAYQSQGSPVGGGGLRGDLGLRFRADTQWGGWNVHAGLGAGFGWLRPLTATGADLGGPLQASLTLGVLFPGR